MWWSGSVSVWLVGLWFASCLHGKVERQTTGEEEEATTEGWWSDLRMGHNMRRRVCVKGKTRPLAEKKKKGREREEAAL